LRFFRNALAFFSVRILKVHAAFFKFTHRDTRGLVLSDIHVRTGKCTPLKLLASLGRKDDHSVLRIYLGRIDNFFLLFNFVPNTVTIAPPLKITRDELTFALEALEQAFTALDEHTASARA